MAIIKCKMCGGDIELAADKTFGTCEFCGSTMTLPKIDDEQRAAAFNRGNHFRRIGEFDKALAVYERIVREDDTDAEAHWCCALCRFGIEYVEDPATYEYLPTCHRASFDSFMEDVDYLAALEHSDGITRRQYQKDAAKIAEVQRGILATSQNAEPYDVFICYKETDDKGERTEDSVLAHDIYDALTAKGMRVFFSRISLEDKLGQDYEPCIFAALNSAKVMLMVTADSDHCQSVWVKNEWKRYLDFMKTDPSKTLIPVYKDISPYTLPDEFSKLQAQDMGKLGAMQDLVRGVEKLAGKNQKAAAAGMTKEEKSYVASLEKGQKRTRALLLGILYAVILAVASFCSEAFGGTLDIMFYNMNGGYSTFTGSPAMLLPLFIYPFHAIGPALTTTYGLKSNGAHWVYLILYVIGAAILCFFGTMGLRPGFLLALPQVVNGVAALLTSFTAYRGKKGAIVAHCAVIIAILAALLVFIPF